MTFAFFLWLIGLQRKARILDLSQKLNANRARLIQDRPNSPKKQFNLLIYSVRWETSSVTPYSIGRTWEEERVEICVFYVIWICVTRFAKKKSFHSNFVFVQVSRFATNKILLFSFVLSSQTIVICKKRAN